MKRILLTTVVGALLAGWVWAGDACVAPKACAPTSEACHICGQHCPQKVCKVVCEMKEVKKTVWEVKCTEHCPPLPRLRKDACDCNCGDPGCEGEAGCKSCCDPCAALQPKRIVPPTCGLMRTKKELVKKEITCKVPVYKCVVVCADCAAQCGVSEEQKPAEKLPPAPAPAPKPKSAFFAPDPPVLGTAFVK